MGYDVELGADVSVYISGMLLEHSKLNKEMRRQFLVSQAEYPFTPRGALDALAKMAVYECSTVDWTESRFKRYGFEDPGETSLIYRFVKALVANPGSGVSSVAIMAGYLDSIRERINPQAPGGTERIDRLLGLLQRRAQEVTQAEAAATRRSRQI